MRTIVEETGEEIQEIILSISLLRSHRDASPMAGLLSDNSVEAIPQQVLNVKYILRLQIFQ